MPIAPSNEKIKKTLPKSPITPDKSPMTTFQLRVKRFDRSCEFELSWGQGQHLCAQLNYPDSLSASYQEWQRVYLNYYRSGLRGRVEACGRLISASQIDWHAKLVQAEAKLLSEFHQWLRSAELYEIRSQIGKGLLSVVGDRPSSDLPLCRDKKKRDGGEDKIQQPLYVFLTCHSIELERLPWETWEISPELATFGEIRLVRSAVNIRQEPYSKYYHKNRKKVRILAILGDDTGLNFQADKKAVRSLSRCADVEFVGWQPNEEIDELRAKIKAAIADERGWDVLFFAGHSNETSITGGELAIAPNVSMSICEIAAQLLFAKKLGLKFAFFNSCNGLSLAHSLIDLGLSQVAVMREPIHDRVAQVFLVRFLQALADRKDVHESLLAACQHLKLSQNLTYPSAYLVPSLFCHPEATLFQIKPAGWKQWLSQIEPRRTEAIALCALTFLSLSLPVQDFLLEKRVLMQAMYRQISQQIPAEPPPVMLVQIDEKSLREAGIGDPKPMDRVYLARLIEKLAALDARVVGIDYLLDRPHGESDRILSRSVQTAVQRNTPTWFVFASVRDDLEGWLTVLPEIASPHWSLQGHIHLTHWYVTLVPEQYSSSQKLPFAYLMALAYQFNQEAFPAIARRELSQPPTPNLKNPTPLFLEVRQYLKSQKNLDEKILFSASSKLQPITRFSYKLGQMWFHPILDFSIPPERVYDRISAWELLQSPADSPQWRHVPQQVVAIAPKYGEAGIFADGEDNFTLPAAVSYWFDRADSRIRRGSFTGGEAHAYTIHHLLNRRLVVPIPDLWLIGLAVLVGKGITGIWLQNFARSKGRWVWETLCIGTTAVYGIVSLQLYISAAIVLPWLLPTLTFWIYAIAPIRQNRGSSVFGK